MGKEMELKEIQKKPVFDHIPAFHRIGGRQRKRINKTRAQVQDRKSAHHGHAPDAKGNGSQGGPHRQQRVRTSFFYDFPFHFKQLGNQSSGANFISSTFFLMRAGWARRRSCSR
jgi:hypothetical protein